MAAGKKTYYQVSFTGGQALAAVIVVILALGLAFFFGARAGFERAGETEPATAPKETPTAAAPAATESVSTTTRPVPATTSAAAASASPAPGNTTEETPVFEDREAGVGETPRTGIGENPKTSVGETPPRTGAGKTPKTASGPATEAPSRTEIAGAPSTASPAPSKPAAPASPSGKPETGPETPARKASPPAKGGYWVQVISTSSKTEASRWKEKLAARSYRTAAVTSVDSKKGKLYRVRTGPYPDRAQAKKAAEKISAQFKQKAWVAAE